jgi:hypothetical protein
MTSRVPLSTAALRVAVVTALLLLVPALAMQFTGEVDWGPGDFAAAAALIFGAGMAGVLAFRAWPRPGQRALAAAAIVLAAGLVWAELAVGLFS